MTRNSFGDSWTFTHCIAAQAYAFQIPCGSPYWRQGLPEPMKGMVFSCFGVFYCPLYKHGLVTALYHSFATPSSQHVQISTDADLRNICNSGGNHKTAPALICYVCCDTQGSPADSHRRLNPERREVRPEVEPRCQGSGASSTHGASPPSVAGGNGCTG